MKQFVVYQAPGEGEFQAVKNGWSWPGCLFVGFWAFSKKMWGVGCLQFVVGWVVLWIMEWSFLTFNDPNDPSDILLYSIQQLTMTLVMMHLWGHYSNVLRARHLLKRGYAQRAVVTEQTAEEAILQYVAAKEGDKVQDGMVLLRSGEPLIGTTYTPPFTNLFTKREVQEGGTRQSSCPQGSAGKEDATKARLFCLPLAVAVCALWASLVGAQGDQDQQRKMVVGIGEIQYKAAGYSQSEAFGDMLLTALVRTRKFKVIERERLEAIYEEQGMQIGGLLSGGRSGWPQARGVDYIITGAITEYGQNEQRMGFGNFSMSKTVAAMAVDIRLLKVEDGEILLAESVRSTKEGGSSMRTSRFSTGQGMSGGALLGDVMRECANKVSALVTQNIPSP